MRKFIITVIIAAVWSYYDSYSLFVCSLPVMGFLLHGANDRRVNLKIENFKLKHAYTQEVCLHKSTTEENYQLKRFNKNLHEECAELNREITLWRAKCNEYTERIRELEDSNKMRGPNSPDEHRWVADCYDMKNYVPSEGFEYSCWESYKENAQLSERQWECVRSNYKAKKTRRR